MSTYGDMVTLLLCFFVLLFSMSSVDIAKFKAAMASFANQIDILPGGETLTDGEMLNNGISQLNDIQVIFQGGMPNNETGDDTEYQENPVDEKDDNLKQGTTKIEDYAKELKEKFEKIIEEKGLAGGVQVSNTATTVKFTLKGEYLFDSGKADLKADAKKTIDVIAVILKNEDYKAFDVQIEGHTDNLSINSAKFPNNWILSSYRAYAVLEELLDKYQFDPAKVSATGYGEYRPVADNDSVEGRAKNRRVEIKIILDQQAILLEDNS